MGGLIASLFFGLSSHAAQNGKPILAIVAPWNDAEDLFWSTGGTVLQTGLIKSVAVGYSSDPDYATTLASNGAWIVAGGELADLLCITSNGDE